MTNPSTMVYRVKAATLTTASNSSSPTTVPMLDARDALLVSAASSASSATTCGAPRRRRATRCRPRSPRRRPRPREPSYSYPARTPRRWLDARFVRGRVHRLGDGRGEHRLGLRRRDRSRGFEITGSDDVSISGVTIKRGLASTGGGIKMTNAGSVTIQGVDVVQCKSQTMGGGVHSINSSPVIRDSRFISNSGGNDRSGNNNRGGGAYCKRRPTRRCAT